MAKPNALSIIHSQFPHSDIEKVARVQSLWSDYGEIARYVVDGNHPVILKWVTLPEQQHKAHPRGWSGHVSNQRKISSYINEQRFYRQFSQGINERSYVPRYIAAGCYPSESNPQCMWLLMEDLDAIGFEKRLTLASLTQVKQCIDWLAHFHATFLSIPTPELWQIGTYWHLATRQEEFTVMQPSALKMHAHSIDNVLNSAKYQTLLHGDAKLANFCFDDKHNKVAAVDFQYTGRGAGVRDLCYLIGSCYFGHELDAQADALKQYYFTRLQDALLTSHSLPDIEKIVTEWDYLYAFCWADFERFLRGWAPDHNKLSGYSKKMTDLALSQIEQDMP